MIVNRIINSILIFISVFLISSCGGGSGGTANPTSDLSTISLLFIGIVKNEPLRIHDMPIGGFLQLTANGKNTAAETIDLSSTVTWSVEDSAVATVTADGLLDALSVGITNVVATRGSETLKAKVGVSEMVLSIEGQAAQYVVGSTLQFIAYVRATANNALISINQSITWESSDITVADIGVKGYIQFKKGGPVDITGHFYGVSHTITLQVIP